MPITANVTNEQITASVGETQIDVSVSGGVGPSGAAGSNGQAATVAVGTVTTGAAGSQASVTNVGTSSAAVFDFTIPAGATGATGPQGATGPAGTTTWAGITDKPTFAAVATSGSASDLSTGTLNASRLPASVVRTNTASAGPIQVYAVTAFPSPPPADPNDYMLFEGYDGVDMTSNISASGVIACAAITLNGTDLATALSGKAAVSHAHSAADVTSGVFDVALLPVGTGSTQVAAGNHTHTQLHDRSHAITSTSDHTAGNWKVIYTNGSGQVIELALGAANTVLQSNGASSAPSFAAVSGESFHPFLLAGM